MAQKVKMIFNPIANLGRAYNLSAPLHSLLPEGSDWSETAYPNHAKEIARQAADQGYDLVVAMGGDGTVHEVLNGLMEAPAEQRPAMGVVPTGSGNDFSFMMGVTPQPEAALRQVLVGTPRTIDVGMAHLDNGQQFYFSNTIGIGFDTLVTIHSRHIPLVHGFAVYFAAVLQTIIQNHNPFHIKATLDGKAWEDELLMLVLCNGQREGGGFLVSPTSRPDDGVLDFVYVHRISRLRMLMTLPYFLKGTQASLKHVGTGQFKKFELNSDRALYIHSDGEIIAGFGSKVHQLSTEIIPGALRMVS